MGEMHAGGGMKKSGFSIKKINSFWKSFGVMVSLQTRNSSVDEIGERYHLNHADVVQGHSQLHR